MDGGDGERLRICLERYYAALEAEGRADAEAACDDAPHLVASLRRLAEQGDAAGLVLGAVDAEALGRDPAEIEDPRALGDFELLRLIGEGGMGRVYLAEQRSLGRLVALKVLNPALAADRREWLRFRREAAIAASIEHPGIVPIHAVGEAEGRVFIAMKWLSGPSLDRLPLPLDAKTAAVLGAAVARALHEAHMAGVIHRDVKPANVLLDLGRPCLVDFGLARAPGDPALTRTGAVPGTLAYMSPEQLRGRSSATDPRTDVYGLGATLFELATGMPPFRGDDREALIDAVLGREPPRLGLPAEDRDFETIVRRALDKDPERRFLSAAAMADDLERFVERRPIESRPLGLLVRSARAVRRNPRTAAAGFALVAGMIVFLVLWLLGVRESERELAREEERLAAALESGALEPARRSLARLAVLRPERFGAGSAAAAAVAAKEAVEALLDQVQDRAEVQDPERLRALVAAVEDAAVDPADRRSAALGAAVAALHLGENGRALAFLEGLAPGRDVFALAAVAKGEAPWPLPEAPAASVEERVFTALALRIAGRPFAERARELEAALALAPGAAGHERAHYAWGILLAEGGEHREALTAFRGLLLVGREFPGLHRNVARQLLIAGDVTGAFAALDRVAPGRRTTSDAFLRADGLLRLGRFAEARALAAEALLRGPVDAQLHLVLGRAAAMEGDLAAARGAFEEARAAARRPVLVQDAEGALLALELAELAPGGDVEPIDALEPRRRGAIEDAAARAAALAAAARDGGLRAACLTIEARARRLLGESAASWRCLEAALEADATCPAPRVFFANHVLQRHLRLRSGRAPVPGDVAACGPLELRIPEARRHAAAVIAASARGPRPPAPDEIEECRRAAAFLAAAARDPAACAEAAQAALAIMDRRPPRASDPTWRRHLEALLAWSRNR